MLPACHPAWRATSAPCACCSLNSLLTELALACLHSPPAPQCPEQHGAGGHPATQLGLPGPLPLRPGASDHPVAGELPRTFFAPSLPVGGELLCSFSAPPLPLSGELQLLRTFLPRPAAACWVWLAGRRPHSAANCCQHPFIPGSFNQWSDRGGSQFDSLMHHPEPTPRPQCFAAPLAPYLWCWRIRPLLPPSPLPAPPGRQQPQRACATLLAAAARAAAPVPAPRKRAAVPASGH